MTVECMRPGPDGQNCFVVHVSRVPVVDEIVMRRVGTGWELYRVDAVHHYGDYGINLPDPPPPTASAAILYVERVGGRP